MALFLAGVACVAAPAYAEDAAASADASAGGDIIVTAQKRQQRLVDVPSSVAVIDPTLLKESGARDLIDVSQLTPGVVVSPQITGGRTMQTFTIRGIGFDDFRPNGSPSAAVNVDGIYQGSSALVGGQMFDVERIEILKGPQGTLYGQNTTAGVVNIISKQPTDRLEGEGRLEYGRFNSVRGEAAVGGPIAPGIALRVAGIYDHTDGYITNLGSGSTAGTSPSSAIPGVANPGYNDKAGRDTYYGGRAILTVERGGTHLAFNMHGFKENGTIGQFERQQPLKGFAPNAPFTIDSDVFPALHKSSYGGSISLTQDIGSSLSLVALAGYEKLTQDYVSNGDILPNRTGDGVYDDSLHQKSLEIRLQNRAPSRFEWVIGATAFQNWIHFKSTLDLTEAIHSVLQTDYLQKSRSIAVFGDGTLHLGRKWKLGLGLRYTDDSSRFSGSTLDLDPYGLTLGGSAFPGLPLIFARHFHDSAPSGRAVVTYDLNDSTSLYASVSRGFKAGGFDGSTNLSLPETNPFKPEKVWTYEAGVKFLPRGGPVQIQASAYYNDFTNLQANAVRIEGALPTSVRTNVGKARTYGMELDVTVKPVERLEMQFGAALLDSKVLEIVSDSEAERLRRLGNDLPYAPHMTFTGAIRYEIPIGNSFSLVPSINGRFIDDYYTELDNYEAIKGYFLGNAQVELRLRNGLSISGWIRNFTNVHYATGLYVAPPTYSQLRGAPRTYGVAASFQF